MTEGDYQYQRNKNLENSGCLAKVYSAGIGLIFLTGALAAGAYFLKSKGMDIDILDIFRGKLSNLEKTFSDLENK